MNISTRVGRAFLLNSLLALAMTITGCDYDDDDIDADETDLVITKPEPGYNFAQLNTYAMPNDVKIISDPEASNPITITDTMEQVILQGVEANMNAAGYKRITTAGEGKPDIVVEVSVMSSTYTGVYYDYWYPTWGYYYDPWYGSYYSSYWAPYAVPYVMSASVGTIMVNVTDPNHPDEASQKIPVVWVGLSSGLLGDYSEAEKQSRVSRDINQMFIQSPYFRRTADGQ